MLLKWDGEGNLLWSHSYDLGVIVSSAWTPTCIWGEGDSVFLTVGYSYYYSLEFVGDFLVKMDVDGNIIWKKQLVSDEWVTLDYGWASAAGTYTCGAYLFSIMITKWDTNGNVIWRQKPLRGDLTSAWGNNTAVYLSGMNDLTHKLFFAKVSLAPLEWHRILVPIACGGGILCIVAYMMWKDRKSKQGQKAISSVRTAYLDRLATVCPNCGKRIAKQWEHCPYCGNKI